MSFSVIPLVSPIPVSWALLPFVKEEIIKFCKEYDPETDGIYLARQYELWFVQENPQMFALAIVDENHVLKGHVLCSVDEWCGRKYLTIVQYNLHETVPEDLHLKGMDMIYEFARLQYCDVIKILARSKAAERLFSSRYGFEYNRSILKKNVPTVLKVGTVLQS